MGDSLRRNNASNMKFLVVVLLAVTALTYASYETGQSDAWDMDEALPENMPSSAQKPVKSLMDAVKKLHKHAPTQLKEHVKVMAHHASMIQDTKAKAYVHNLKSAQATVARTRSHLSRRRVAQRSALRRELPAGSVPPSRQSLAWSSQRHARLEPPWLR